MISQNAFNVIAEVDPARIESLHALLDRMKQDPERNSILPFGRLPKVHFGRLVLIPEAMGPAGSIYRPLLVLALNIDGDVQAQLDELVRVAATGLAEIYSHCHEFPHASADADLLAYLRAHLAPADAFYINTIGRSLAQVQLEARLHEALQTHLDGRGWAHLSPGDVHARLVSYVKSEPDLTAALTPAVQPRRLLGWLKLALFALGGLVLALLLLSLLLPLLLLGLVVLRLHEIGNRADHYRPPNVRISELEKYEDTGVQNPFSAVGYVQAGLFRRVLLRAGLFVLQLVSRYLYNHGKLADVDSIHFARWVGINDWRRLYFFSNFDGSAESYQDDFIERIAFGLNLVFSNGWGWPRNRYLLFAGASDEQAFKAYYRDHQIDTNVWYRAPVYKGFTAVNLANNAAIRAGLGIDMNDEQARAWLKLL